MDFRSQLYADILLQKNAFVKGFLNIYSKKEEFLLKKQQRKQRKSLLKLFKACGFLRQSLKSRSAERRVQSAECRVMVNFRRFARKFSILLKENSLRV